MTSLPSAAVILAVDRLNGHARAYGCGKHFIYAAKTLAAMMLADGAGNLLARPVALMSQCHRCYGTGIFHWDGAPTGEACRTCVRTGYVHLRFCETTLGTITWHHPWDPYGEDIYRIARKLHRTEYLRATRTLRLIEQDGSEREVGFEDPGEWKPLTRGEKLLGDPAAVLLNDVEDWIETMVHDAEYRWRWRANSAEHESRRYSLDLGQVGERCHYCDGEKISRQGHIAEHLHWSIPVCEAHYKMPVTEWDNIPPINSFTPAIERWLNRRGWKRWEPATTETAG